MLEIGVGEGALTRHLLDAGAIVHGIEIDEALIPALKKMEDEHERFHLIHGDALEIDYATLPKKMKLVANLPYQVASAIISQLTEKIERFPLMVLMVQREVGERLCAAPGGKDYGSLTLWVGHRYKTKLCLVVPPGAFRPPPKVDSAIIRLEAREKPRVDVGDEKLYFRIIQAGFAHRRKTLFNNLKSLNLYELNDMKKLFSNPEALRNLLERADIDPRPARRDTGRLRIRENLPSRGITHEWCVDSGNQNLDLPNGSIRGHPAIGFIIQTFTCPL